MHHRSTAVLLVAVSVGLAFSAFAQSSTTTTSPSTQTIVAPTTSGSTVTTITEGASDAAKPKEDKKE